ncbi:uncharacterized protein LOC126815678 [Patella vulgata]|uniref:uncharacterized protein LOC126815678 n=1 Tax=Patella vulgata TaxID=6465 RepID=UPI0024A8B50B|nr:uncharacterized protein LOC126815678 [Patella vulgata]
MANKIQTLKMKIDDLETDNKRLQQAKDNLEIDFTTLQADHELLQNEHQLLQEKYDEITKINKSTQQQEPDYQTSSAESVSRKQKTTNWGEKVFEDLMKINHSMNCIAENIQYKMGDLTYLLKKENAISDIYDIMYIYRNRYGDNKMTTWLLFYSLISHTGYRSYDVFKHSLEQLELKHAVEKLEEVMTIPENPELNTRTWGEMFLDEMIKMHVHMNYVAENLKYPLIELVDLLDKKRAIRDKHIIVSHIRRDDDNKKTTWMLLHSLVSTTGSSSFRVFKHALQELGLTDVVSMLETGQCTEPVDTEINISSEERPEVAENSDNEYTLDVLKEDEIGGQ